LLLEVRSLVVHYGMLEALKGLSLKVKNGQIVILIGANGAGKSTALSAISGLKQPTSGEVWFRGERIEKKLAKNRVKKGIGHILEGRRVFSAMTVRENLEMGAYLRNDREQIKEDLEEIYQHFPVLKERQMQSAGNLSGGEQQMLATARALMSKPELLLMDEPSLGLSPLLVREVANIIQAINERGVSIVLVEQNARMALSLADYAYILEVGSIVLEGKAVELISDQRVRKAYLGG